MKDSWENLTIDDIVEDISDGGTPPRTDSENFGGSIPWVVIDDIKSEIYTTKEYLSEKGFKNCSSKLWPINTLILSTGATIGEVGLAKVPLTTKQGIAGIKLKEIIDIDYAYYIFLSLKNEIQRLSQGSTIQEIRPKYLKQIGVKITNNKLQQRKIASILSTCDEVIEKTEAAIAKYQALKQGMMYDLFTRGIDVNTGKLRPSHQDAPKLYKESKLGMIPKDWGIKRLEDIGQILYGKDYKANPKGDSIPIYGTGGIMGWTSLVLNSGPAVLTGRKGTINKPIYIEGDFWNVDTIFCINTKQGTNVKWFYYQMTAKDLMKLNEATGVPSVSSTALNNLKFSYPKTKEQDEIANRINVIENKIQTEQATLFKYQQLKAGLMQDLLSGEVEVSVAEEILKN